MILQGRLEIVRGKPRVVLSTGGRNGKNLALSDAEFTRLYLKGVKISAIAKRAGMATSGVKDRRKRLGLPGRPVGRQPKKPKTEVKS